MFYAPTQSCWLRRCFRRALNRTRVREAGTVSASSRMVIDSDPHKTKPKKRKPSELNLKFSPDGVLFHVEHYAEALVFLPPREDRQSDPESKTRDNADCATEFLPQGRRIYPAHVSAARAETARGWLHVSLVMSESVGTRGNRSLFQLQNRASPESLRSGRSAPI